MRIIRRFLFGQILASSAMICIAFLVLFGFFDLVDELGSLKAGYGLPQALGFVLALMPDHLYDLLPIGVLIGCVLVLSRLALNSEFTILRTSGLGPVRMLTTLLGMGLMFSVLTMLLGDYLAPASNRLADRIKGEQHASGAWLRDKQAGGQFFVYVAGLDSRSGQVQGVRILQFNPAGQLQTRIEAPLGLIDHPAQAQEAEAGAKTGAELNSESGWQLQQVRISRYPVNAEAQQNSGEVLSTAAIEHQSLAQYHWNTALSKEMVSTAMVSPGSMATFDLYRYAQHLQANQQNAATYEIALWRKLLYPLSCLVMVMLALPFAYLHHRNGTATGYVFIGVLMGVGFYLFNNVTNHIGNLRGWEPWLAAALPSMVFGSIALAAFTWLVTRR